MLSRKARHTCTGVVNDRHKICGNCGRNSGGLFDSNNDQNKTGNLAGRRGCGKAAGLAQSGRVRGELRKLDKAVRPSRRRRVFLPHVGADDCSGVWNNPAIVDVLCIATGYNGWSSRVVVHPQHNGRHAAA